MELVEEHRSLRKAAMSMGMAYSKAWRIIRTAEEVFGCPLLHSTIGGKNGGGAELTAEGKKILTAYQHYVADVKKYSQSRFEEAFAFFKDL
jgi:molybdate transport repressor ModE-like protein